MQALQSGLAVVEAATTATAHALMQTFLSSRRGPNDEDLMELLSFPTEQGEGWFRALVAFQVRGNVFAAFRVPWDFLLCFVLPCFLVVGWDVCV